MIGGIKLLFKYVIELLVFVVGQVLGLFSSIIPNSDLSILTNVVQTFLGVSTQVSNFLYFLFGDTYFNVVILLTWFIPFKYVVTPVLCFFRKLIVFGGGQG